MVAKFWPSGLWLDGGRFLRSRRLLAQALAGLVLASSLDLSGSPIVMGGLDELEPALAGRVLLSELNCTRCHGGMTSSRGAPNLADVGSRVDPDYLTEFLLSPQQAKPGTTMPEVLGRVAEEEREKVAELLADHILGLGASLPDLEPQGAVDLQAVERGSELYHKMGCVACHDPADAKVGGSVPLHRLGEKFTRPTLVAFLEDPLAVRPGGRMPKFDLEPAEATDLASYLLRDTLPGATPRPKSGGADEGKKWFDSLQCAQCHEASEPRATTLADLKSAEACTSMEYPLSNTQRSWISAALQTLGEEVDPADQIVVEMARLNCLACHERDGLGGPEAERDGYFTTENLNLGEQARIPPTLTHVGAKLTPESLRKMVAGDRVHRPYMHTRMPAFGTRNAHSLLELLSAHDKLPEAEFKRVADRKVARESGHALVGDKYLSCVACHTFNGDSTTTLNAIDLNAMTGRLQENWFHLYLRNPQEFHDTTIMPNFWPNGKPVRPDMLDGDSGKQVDAIWQYLQAGRGARIPSGVRPEPIHYGPIQGEAVMLRRQYRGIGKRGIGVGYPAGVNLAFDAAQCRLGSVWEGPFAEMSGVWRGQGSGNVHEGGEHVHRFSVGPAFATLESAEALWPVLKEAVKAEGFQFEGYTLDPAQRPTFRYSFVDIQITDGFLDESVGPTLVRKLRFDRRAPENLYFRAAAGETLSQESKRIFRLGEKLQLETSADARLRQSGGEAELVVPLAGLKGFDITYRFVSP